MLDPITTDKEYDMKTLLIMVLTYVAVEVVHMGIAYEVVGYGLHPIIAFAVAVGCIGLPLMWELVEWMVERDVNAYEHITLEQAHCSNCGQHKDLVNGRCVHGCTRS